MSPRGLQTGEQRRTECDSHSSVSSWRKRKIPGQPGEATCGKVLAMAQHSEERCEYIDGQAFRLASPGMEHKLTVICVSLPRADGGGGAVVSVRQ